ncbi:disulfide isomeras-like protein [Eremomyces bilateralis CBS 781.70]|uniref:Disulfide isomeras-like protein n=1 Tax=Eremomyces bilateralis CBS 781.70 TaxID=1392243 RepID=A0A6G1G559_9PEZI|nr:disulfide isomeras-like protein [Eremomyces bilateralis CBS 781.70]KAF1813225.1 disulfide isomeras-like protein [Eremomyces bilateralis CBS 781.70]
MRPLWFSAAALALLSPVLGLAMEGKSLEERDAKTTDSDDEPQPTIFNAQEVPPLEELTLDSIDEHLQNGHWFVEFFSPICHHCQELAPTWQTLYEFYYTVDPLAGISKGNAEALNTFNRYYKFNFARVNCVTNADACAAKDVNSYPTIRMYKDGKQLKSVTGVNSLKFYSDWIEETLETIRPGSRQREGLQLPDVGASTTPDFKPPTPGKKPESKPVPTNESGKPIISHPKPDANPNGESKVLTSESFKTLVTETGDSWFVKFYSPGCPHCIHMAPNWVEMARAMKGKLNVGEVNCDIERQLCKDAKVKMFPTISFFRGGERVEYDGMRGVGDFVDFAEKGAELSDGIADVDLKAFEKMEEKEPVLFIYCYDHATTTEDFAVLEKLTLALIGHGKLVKTKDKKMFERFKVSTWPRLLVSRDTKSNTYAPITPKEMRDFRKILTWMKTVWLPLVPELTAQNSHEIMDGKLVVLGILSRQRTEFETAIREIKNAAGEWMDKEQHAFDLEQQELRDAKQLRIEEAEDRNDEKSLKTAKLITIDMDQVDRKKVRFAWVDGIFWERWIRTTYGIDVNGGESVIINDQANRRYWDTTITGNHIMPSRTSILETLPKVIANPPKIPAKSTHGSIGRVVFGITSFASNHSFISLGIVVGALLLVYLTNKHRVRRRSHGHTPGFFHMSDPEKMMGGFMGGGAAAGKVD